MSKLLLAAVFALSLRAEAVRVGSPVGDFQVVDLDGASHAFSTLNFWWLLAGVVQGYAWAWAGHFFFEHNRPATFTHPLYSLMGDWVMWKQILTGQIKF